MKGPGPPGGTSRLTYQDVCFCPHNCLSAEKYSLTLCRIDGKPSLPGFKGSSGEQELLRRSPVLLLITCRSRNPWRASEHAEVSLSVLCCRLFSFSFEQMTPAIKATTTELCAPIQSYKTDIYVRGYQSFQTHKE